MNDSFSNPAIILGIFFLGLVLGGLLVWLLMREKLKARQSSPFELELLTKRAVESSTQQILNLASERFKLHVEQGNSAQSQQREQLYRTLAPITTTLNKLEEQVNKTEKHRLEASALLNSQLKMLSDKTQLLSQEANSLKIALNAPASRGRWGEVQLRNIVEAAGMLNQVDFVTQANATNLSGDLQRPDLIVNLSSGRSIVIDAKVPMDAYLSALHESDSLARTAALKAHAAAMSKHVKTLSSKAYWNALDDTPEFVVMFVPADGLLASALESDPLLLETAFKNNVVIASPATLMALLKTVAHTWRTESLNQDAKEALETCRELYARMQVFTGHLNQVGKGLNAAVSSFNKAAGSYSNRLLPSLRNLDELNISSERIEPLEAINAHPREDFELYRPEQA